MGFEPTRAEHNGLAVHRLNLSATSSYLAYLLKLKLFLFLRQLLQWWQVAVDTRRRKKTIAEKTGF